MFEVDLRRADGRVPLPQAQPVSRLPVVRRDLAVVVDEACPAQALLDALRAAQRRRTSTTIALFDVYRGTGIDSRQEKPCDSGAYAGY